MLERRRTLYTAGSLLVAVLLTVAISAAPAVPRPPARLPDPVRSLKGINAVRVEVSPLPREIESRVRRAEFVAECRKKLEVEGFQIVDDDDNDAPTLRINVYTASHERDPGIIGYCFVLEVYQTVGIDRLEATKLSLPTFINVSFELSDRDTLDLRQSLRPWTLGLSPRCRVAAPDESNPRRSVPSRTQRPA
ncbi:MAG: hypothetical protein CMJ18_23980 [Phycisphaeraceae bacterium]|nr:hypothetical protein [Phycisphaeraceae bacterium]